MNSEIIHSMYNNAIELFKNNNYDDSEKEIIKIIEILGDNSDVLNFYGRLKQFKGQFDESIKLLSKSIEVDNANHMAHYNLALAYCIKKDLDKSKHHFEQYRINNTTMDDSNYMYNLYISKLHFDKLDIIETQKYYYDSRIPLFQQLSKLLVPRVYETTEDIQLHRQNYYKTLSELYDTHESIILHDTNKFTEYLQFIYCYAFPLSYQGENNNKILQLQVDNTCT